MGDLKPKYGSLRPSAPFRDSSPQRRTENDTFPPIPTTHPLDMFYPSSRGTEYPTTLPVPPCDLFLYESLFSGTDTNVPKVLSLDSPRRVLAE